MVVVVIVVVVVDDVRLRAVKEGNKERHEDRTERNGTEQNGMEWNRAENMCDNPIRIVTCT